MEKGKFVPKKKIAHHIVSFLTSEKVLYFAKPTRVPQDLTFIATCSKHRVLQDFALLTNVQMQQSPDWLQRSNSTIQLQNIKATMHALRSQLDQEKEMLKNDIVQTLKCKSILGTGSADLLYTSGLLARLKSLEDSREPPLPLDHAGTISTYCLNSRDGDETRKYSGAGEVYQPVHSRERSGVRHCCPLKSAEALKSTSGVEMRTFCSQKFPPQPRFTHHNLPTVEEDPVRMMPERPQPQSKNSWSGDAVYVRPGSKGILTTDDPALPYLCQKLQYNYRPSDLPCNQWVQPPSCPCAPYTVPSYSHCVQEPVNIEPDTRNGHCAACCNWRQPEMSQSAVVISAAELQQEESRRCTLFSPQCRHGSSLHHCSPEIPPPHHSYHHHPVHQKSSRTKRHHSKKEPKRVTNASKSVGNDTGGIYFHNCQEQQVKSGFAVGTQVDEDDEIHAVSPSTKQVHVTPQSTTPNSIYSGQARETLIYDEPGEVIPDGAVGYHYTNELSSQRSDGSSLFGSEVALDTGLKDDPLTCDQKIPQVRSAKPRQRGAKRSTENQGTEKSGRAMHSAGFGSLRSKSTPRPRHRRLPDGDSCGKAPSETATTDLTKGRAKEGFNRSSYKKAPRRSGKPPLLENTMQLPTSTPKVPRKKKSTKGDLMKPLESYYASLATMPSSKIKQSEINLNAEDQKVDSKGPLFYRRQNSKVAPNPFTLIFDEFRSRPLLRNKSVSNARKFA